MSKHRILPPARILTHVGFSLFAILIAAMCLSSYVVADNIYQTSSMPNGTYWGDTGYWSGAVPSSSTANNYYVGQGVTDESIIFRTKASSTSGSSDTFPNGNTLWLGYNTDGTFSSAQGAIALKSWNFTVNNLQLGNSLINQAMNDGTINLKGAMTVNGKVVFQFSDAAGRKINVQSAISGNGEITLAENSNNENLIISSADNAFTGTLTVSKNSTVKLDGANALKNATSVFIDTGATLYVNADQDFVNNNVITGSGTLRVSADSSTLTNAVSDEFTGIINIRNSALLTYSKPLTSNYGLTIANDSQFRILQSAQPAVLECNIRLAGEGRVANRNQKAGALLFHELPETTAVKGKVTLINNALIGAYASVNTVSFTNEIETNGYTLDFRQTRYSGDNNVATFSIESDVLSASGTGTIQFLSDFNPDVSNTFLCFGDPSAADESAPTSQSINVNMINYNKNEIVFQPGANRTVTVSGNLATDSSGNNKGYIKNGDGKFVLTGGLSTQMTVNAGVFELSDDAIENVTGKITVGANGTLELNVAEDVKMLTLTQQNQLFSAGKVIKTGDGELKIDADEGVVDARHLLVSSGRVDIKEYFNGRLEVQSGATFSPGNSIGSLTIGEGAFGGGFTLNEAGAKLLMEIGGEDANLNDALIVNGDITLGNNSIIELVLADNSALKGGDTFTAILYGSNSGDAGFAENLLSIVSSYSFTDLQYVPYGSGYAITGTLAPTAVPEPSTWALMILGVVALFLRRRIRS